MAESRRRHTLEEGHIDDTTRIQRQDYLDLLGAHPSSNIAPRWSWSSAARAGGAAAAKCEKLLGQQASSARPRRACLSPWIRRRAPNQTSGACTQRRASTTITMIPRRRMEESARQQTEKAQLSHPRDEARADKSCGMASISETRQSIA